MPGTQALHIISESPKGTGERFDKTSPYIHSEVFSVRSVKEFRLKGSERRVSGWSETVEA